MSKRHPVIFRSASAKAFAGLSLLLGSLVLLTPAAWATNVLITTPLGDIEVELFDEEAPGTVANFLNYVEDGDFEDSLIHRSVPGFIIQGGGYKIIDELVDFVPTDDPITNEPGIGNTRGTIAMAKRANDPNSATSQWFINLDDNRSNLDNQNGGFTVFGQVVGDGMQVVDAIADLTVYNVNSTFSEIPLIDFDGETVTLENLVLLDINTVSDFVVNPGLNDAWFNPATSGQGFFFTVFPDSDLLFLSWFTYDSERPPADVSAILGEPGHRWLTALGTIEGNRSVLNVALSEGGIFDAIEPQVVTTEGYGEIQVTFNSCDSITVSYEIPGTGLSGVIELQRIVKDNVALCEALASPEG